MADVPSSQANGLTEGESRPLLVIRGLYKRYGGVRALRGANLVVRRRGVVHALVGENGCGKSTLINILAGQVRADAGMIELEGAETAPATARAALAAGIATVTQETALAPELSIAENIFLGRRMVRGPLGIRWRETNRRARDTLAQLGLDLNPAVRVGRLRPDQQQMIEVARALSMNARILVLDEPTSSLTDDEVTAMFAVVRKLKLTGVSTIFVSHRLDDIFTLADEVTVLRDGQTVSAGQIGAYDKRRLIEQMVGRAHEELPPRAPARAGRDALLSVRGLSARTGFTDVTFDVGAGEILGLAGLVGAGRSELMESIFGVRSHTTGTVTLDGRALQRLSPIRAVANGIGFVPSDRKRQGLVHDMSVRENLMMAVTSRLNRFRPPDLRNEAEIVDRTIAGMRIRAASRDARVATLSGGNQQKVVLGKWLAAGVRVLLLDEPTRGVDVGAKAEIYRLLQEAAGTGIAIVISSSETPELLTLCDRILVMFRGCITAVLAGADADEAIIAQYASGHT